MDTHSTPIHPAARDLLAFFGYSHLSAPLQEVSEPFHELAHRLVLPVPQGLGLQGAEATTALRKLLEAKDCAVRAAIVGPLTETAAAGQS